MRSRLAAVLLFALPLVAPLPARAAEPPGSDPLPRAAEKLRSELERAAAAMRESMGRVLLSLEEVARQLPRYEAPEITENGDIIIRRKPAESNERSDRDGTI
jgi:hypothetical protein